MRKLKESFKIQNRFLRRIKREGRIALYELLSAGGLLFGYEVHVIKFKAEGHAFGRLFVAQEAKPRNEEWGIYGFSYPAGNLEKAEERYLKLRQEYPGNVTPPPVKACLTGE